MPFWIINILIMVIWFTNTTGKKWLMDIHMNQIFNSFSYFSLDSETRSLRETFNPMCEVFPNVRKNSKSCWFSFTYFFKHQVAACNWWRWGKDGGQELKNLICILGNNIINQKVKHLCHSSCLMIWNISIYMCSCLPCFGCGTVCWCLLVSSESSPDSSNSAPLISGDIIFI